MTKQLLKIVELTVPEQRVVIFVVCALLGVAALKTYRGRSIDAPAAETDQPSPSPGIRP